MLTNKELLLQESLMSVGNGYVGMRGCFEEGYAKGHSSVRGTYINGAYEIYALSYGENAVGFPQTAQKLINITDAQTIEIFFGDESFSLFEGTVLSLERDMDIFNGYYTRKVEWLSPKGHHLVIEIKRMASFICRELIIIDYHIYSKNYSGDITIVSKLEGDVQNHSDKTDMRLSSFSEKFLHIDKIESEENLAYISSSTLKSSISVNTAMAHDIKMYYAKGNTFAEGISNIYINKGEDINFAKFIVYSDSLRHKDVIIEGKTLLENAVSVGKEYWFNKQKEFLSDFWQYSYIKIRNSHKVEEALNYSLYQLLSSACHDNFGNISAKGLSGEGYEGHYFWDTEIYMIPFFMLTNPEMAKNLIKFRYRILDKARSRSLEMGHKKGAKIPWRTISGDECSSYFPAGSAQYHINADVAYAAIQYYLYTQDIKMMLDFGFELIYETARIWLEIGHFDSGLFKIDAVTGPDEYTALINNNYYTNAMAKYHLQWAVKISGILKVSDIKRYEEIASQINISQEELLLMEKAARSMYLPFDSKLNISLQDDSFLGKADWDFENTPAEKYPLLLHYHPLTIYRYRVLKQPDALLAHMLLDEESDEVIANSYNFYEKYTTHDSSLSTCIHSIMASRIGDSEKAYSYFMRTVRMDLDDINKNTKDGLHLANAGGAYMSIVYGFGGLRIKETGLYLNPIKPPEWNSIEFCINYMGAKLEVLISDTLTIKSNKPVELYVYNDKQIINGQIEFDLHSHSIIS